MSGFAASYDLFTPDAGEMAFLADEMAPHPFYTRGFLLQDEERIPELIERAYKHENAAHCLLVKGRCDFVASEEGILEEISEPCVENMEPIGGTGDSLTGVVSALIAGGFPIPQAALLAAKTNRIMGVLKNPTPAFSIADLLPALPAALEQILSEKRKKSPSDRPSASDGTRYPFVVQRNPNSFVNLFSFTRYHLKCVIDHLLERLPAWRI